MITGTAMRMIISIIRITMSAELGVGVLGQTERAKALTRSVCQLQREQTEQTEPVAYEPLP